MNLNHDPTRPARHFVNHILRMTLLALASFGGGVASHYLALPGLAVSVLWMPAGIGIAALMLGGLRLWPGLALGLTGAALLHGNALGAGLGMAAAGTLGAMGGASLLTQAGVARRLDRLADVLGFVALGALVPALISASLGVAVLAALGSATPLSQAWGWWWVGDGLGALLIGPLVLAWAQPPGPAPRVGRLELACFAVLLGLLVSSFLLAGGLSLGYVLFVPAVWAGLRLGLRGATLTVALLAAATLVAITRQASRDGGQALDDIAVVSFIAVLTLVSLVMASATTEGLLAETGRQQDSDVQRAVVEGSPLAIITLDRDGRVTGWNAAAERIFGYSAAEMMGNFPPLPVRAESDASGFHQAALTGREFSQVMVRRQHRDGAWLQLALSTAPLRDPQGEISGVVEIFADLTEAQKADERIRQREARLNLILEQALDAVITIDSDSIITGWNPRAEQIFGWSAGEAHGRPLADTIIPERHRAAHAAGVARFLRTGVSTLQNRRLEMAALHREGREFPVELTLGSVRQGDSVIFSAFVRDITDQKRAEKALRASEDRYRAFVAQSTEAIWCVEMARPMPTSLPVDAQIDFIYEHGVLSDCNDEMARMYGFMSAGDLIGLRPDQLLVRSDPGNVEYLAGFIRSGYRLTDAESHEVDREGQSKYFLNNLIGIVEGGMLLRAWGTQRDITSQREAHQRTTVFAALALQLSGANDAIDAARVIVGVARELCGWESCSVDLYSADADRIDAVLTIDVVDGASRDNPPAYTGRAPSAIARKVIDEGPQLILRSPTEPGPSGLVPFGNVSRPSASLMFVPIRNKSTVIGILSIQSYTANAYDAQDLALLQSLADQCGAALERIRAEQDLRRAEAQLRQAQKMEAVGRLAGGIAHDFNNLLTTVLGTCDLLLEELPPEKQWREDVEEIRKAGDRAAGLTRQLLAFSRKQVIEAATLDLNDTVLAVSTMLRRLIGEDIELITQLDVHLGMVRADPGQIEQVLLNLAVNSRDALPHGGKLVIETSNVRLEGDTTGFGGIPGGDYVMLGVSDNGTGMDAETRSHIFEPFFTTKEQGKGTGLGLATVYGIVRQSGGHVLVYSEPGAGTTFRVYLPQVSDAPPQHPVPAPAPRRGSETILVAEDEPAVRNLARRILEAQGYTVMSAADAEEALALSRAFQGSIHLLLTDVIMPGLSGPQLAHRIIQERSATRVLYMSGYTDAAIVHHGVLEPGIWYLQKPFSPVGLAEKVREVLEENA